MQEKSNFRSGMATAFEIDTVDMKEGFVVVKLRVETAAQLSSALSKVRNLYPPLVSLQLGLRTAANGIYHEDIDWEQSFWIDEQTPICNLVIDRNGVQNVLGE